MEQRFYRMNASKLPIVDYAGWGIGIEMPGQEFILSYAPEDGGIFLSDEGRGDGNRFLIQFRHPEMERAAIPQRPCAQRDSSVLMLPQQLPLCDHIGYRTRFTELLEELTVPYPLTQRQTGVMKSCRLMELLTLLSCAADEHPAECPPFPADTDNPAINRLLLFLQQQYSEKITGKRIEQLFGCSYDHLNRIFKQKTGCTIQRYLNTLRIARARQLLMREDVSTEQAALQCGFRDVYYFSKVFKKYTGTTPGMYARRRALGKG